MGKEVNQARVRHIPLLVRVMSELLAVYAKRVDENSEALSGKTGDRQVGAWTLSINTEGGYCYSESCQGLHHSKGKRERAKICFELNDAVFFVSLKSRRNSLI